MSTDVDIAVAAFSRVESLATTLRIGYPNDADFDPGNDAAWLEVTLMPNMPDNLSWDSEVQVYSGILQVSVYFRPGGGTVPHMRQAEDIIAHFPKALQLGPVRVERKPYLSAPVKEGSKFFIPVTVPWRGIA